MKRGLFETKRDDQVVHRGAIWAKLDALVLPAAGEDKYLPGPGEGGIQVALEAFVERKRRGQRW